MNETFSYIDDYFQRNLTEIERKNFEERCLRDEEFANEVAFYITTRQALRDTLLEEKKKEWRELMGEQKEIRPVRKMNFRNWLPYAAAASIVLALLLWPVLKGDRLSSMADSYVKTELGSIAQTMDASKDSLQLGIEAYNKQDYKTAEKYFKDIYTRDSSNTDAIQYLGQVYLLEANYDQSLAAFRELGSKQGLFSNPGLFCKRLLY